MKQRIRAYGAAVLALAGVMTAVLWPQAAGSDPTRPGNQVLARALAVELGQAKPTPHRALVSSGSLYAALQASGELEKRADRQGRRGRLSSPNTLGCRNTFTGGSGLQNIRVNQDCSLRRQAEEVVAVNPRNNDNLVAGQNDSRVGFNHCGYDWSFDGGKTWGDQIPPFYQFQLADGHTADACSDPTASFDSQGNVYVAGILFDVAADANALIVMKSNNPIGGAFYHSPDSTLSFQTYRDSPVGVVANDTGTTIFNDKEFIVADAGPASTKRDNVYVTWTRFNDATGFGVGANSPIYFSQSTNGGRTWSPGIEISGANSAVCTVFSGQSNPNACDQDQGSHPIVGPDGTVYVAFGNGNTPGVGINQHLIVKCPASADCSNPANWTPPVKISDDYGTQPSGPVASTGCPSGRQCLPPNGYRLDDFVEGSVSVDSSGRLYFVWADFRNGGANCNPNGPASTATPPCNNDVFYAFSTDGGATWSSARLVTPPATFGQTAQWQPWSQVAPQSGVHHGNRLWIAFYDRSYGTCETTGCNDITLASVNDALASSPSFTYQRITTSSMPNLVPANNPLQAGFLGDYMWLTLDQAGAPLVVWADTRGTGGGDVEEDIYFYRQ